MVTFNEANDGSTVNVSWTSKFAVTLEENPTTGYSWNMTLSPGLELVSNNYIEKTHAAGMVGVGGTRTWIIQANDIGSQKVTAIYKRPWEADNRQRKALFVDRECHQTLKLKRTGDVDIHHH